jgi:hypothetical protein
VGKAVASDRSPRRCARGPLADRNYGCVIVRADVAWRRCGTRKGCPVRRRDRQLQTEVKAKRAVRMMRTVQAGRSIWMETQTHEKSFGTRKHRIMEATVARANSLKNRGRGDGFKGRTCIAVKSGLSKMYMIGANREIGLLTARTVSLAIAISCGLVLLARDVHYAFA